VLTNHSWVSETDAPERSRTRDRPDRDQARARPGPNSWSGESCSGGLEIRHRREQAYTHQVHRDRVRPDCTGRKAASFSRTVHRATYLLFLFALLPAPSAWGQPAGASTAEQGAGVAGCYVLTVYGLVPTCTLSPAQLDENASRAAAYLTDGARVTAAPSAGPGAAYFHNASHVLAAPTTSWVQTVNPELGAGAFGGSGAVAAPHASATAAKPSAALEQPAAQPSVAPPAAQPSAPPSAAAAAVADAMEATAEPPPVPSIEAVPSGPTTEVATPGVSAPVALPQSRTASPNPPRASVEPESPSATGLPQSVLFAIIGTPIGALLVFVAVRALALRARDR